MSAIRHLKLATILTSMLVLFGCASTVQRAQLLEPGVKHDDDSALFLVVVHNPNRSARLFFKGVGNDSFETPEFPQGLSRNLLAVPPGKYELTAIYFGSIKTLTEDFLTLELLPGVVNYAGDFAFDGLTTQILDLSPVRYDWLDETYPALVNTERAFRGTVVKDRRNISEGSYRLPNNSGRLNKVPADIVPDGDG